MAVLAQMSWGQWFVGMALLGTCGLLILVVLLQRGRGGGLAGAFGGGGGSSAFGAKTGDVFTWITVVVATVFLGLAVAANYVFDDTAPARFQAADLPEVPIPAPPGDTTTAPATESEVPPIPPSSPLGAGLGMWGSPPEGRDTTVQPYDVGDETPTDEKAQEQPAP